MNITVRQEAPDDIEAIRHVNIKAFANHPFSRQTEHLIVEALRDAQALTVSLVAEHDGTVVGHIAFSSTLINGDDVSWYALGPVAVLPSLQNQGIGSELIRAGLKSIQALGARGCSLVGDPNYYKRFGFCHTDRLGIPGVPAQYFLCLPFENDAPSGEVALHPAFFVVP